MKGQHRGKLILPRKYEKVQEQTLRHLRNRMAHELDTDGVCTETDVAEAEDFHARILSGDDPLARLNRMAVPEKKPAPARTSENLAYDPAAQEKTKCKIWIGIAITAAVICLLAIIPIFFL